MGVTTFPNKIGAVVSGIYSDRSHILLPFGDSHTGTMWRQWTLTGNITTSAGETTVTLTATHNFPAGTRLRLSGCSFSGFEKIHTVTTTPSATTFTFAAPGGAPASETTTGAQYAWSENDQAQVPNYITAFKMYSKCRFYMPYNGGVGGDTVTEGLARVGDAVAQNPGRALVMLGTNEALNAASSDASTTLAELALICKAFLDAGIAVDLCTIPPFGSGYADVSNTTKVSWLTNYNRGIRKYAQETNGVHLHDVYSWVTDPAQANGQARANYLGADGVHFNTASTSSGAFVVGENMAANYVNWLGPAQDKLPRSQAEGQTFSSLSKNKWTNHLFLDADVNGTADGWTILYTGGGNSQIPTCVARNTTDDGDDFGNNQVSSLTSAVSGTHLVYRDPSAAMTAGKTYIGRGTCRVNRSTLTQLQIELNFSFTVATIVRTVKMGSSYLPEDGIYHFETPPFIYPAGASAIGFYLRGVTTGTGSPVIRWGRVDLEQVD